MQDSSDDDGLYDLIGIDDNFDNDSETCRTDDLLFNTNSIDWSRIKVNVNHNMLNQNSYVTEEECTSKDSKVDALKSINHNLKTYPCSDGHSARCKLVNMRAEANMDFYLPLNMRRNLLNDGGSAEYCMCRECGKENTVGVDWCLFCGVILIKSQKSEQSNKLNENENRNISELDSKIVDTTHLYNGSVKWRHMEVEEIDDKSRERIEAKAVKLDLGGLETVRASCSDDWDFDIEIDENVPSIFISSASRPIVVPPLDLSNLDSTRQTHAMVKLDDLFAVESKENSNKPTRKWETSSSAWVDIPQNVLKKKPSSYYRSKLNSCTNKIGITVYRSGMEDDCEEIPRIDQMMNGIQGSEGILGIESLAVNKEDIEPIIEPDRLSKIKDIKYDDIVAVPSRQTVVIDLIHREDGAVSHWQCLPAEIWIKVMSYLSHHQLSQLQQTCRRLYSIGLESSLWRIISLNRHTTLSNDDIIYIAKKMPKELHFKTCYGIKITSNGLVDMFKICGDGLRKISFISCSKGAFEDDLFLLLSAIFCPNVTHINASYLQNLREDTLKKMIEGFTKIESLNIMGAHAISNNSIKYLIEHHRTSLINLDFYGCFKLNSLTLTLLEECLNLRSLALGSINNLKRSALVDMLKKLSQLTILDLRGTMNLVDDSLLDNICRSCPGLQQIILTNSCRLTNDGVIGLANSCVSASLKILDICGCSKITERGVEEVLKQCRQLEDLDISCTGVRGNGAKIFRVHCPPKLRCLRINNNKFISDTELISLIVACKKLGTVYMCGTTSVGSWRKIEQRFPHVTFKHE